MLLTRISSTPTTIVSLADVKTQARVDFSDDDALLSSLILSAVEAVQQRSGRTLGTEQWTVSYPGVSGDILLPKSPVQTIDAATYYDVNGAQQTLDLGQFYRWIDEDKAIIRPKAAAFWPATQMREDAISFTFTVGYGANLPEPLKTAIKMIVSFLYQNRESTMVGRSITQIPIAADDLIDLYRVGWVA